MKSDEEWKAWIEVAQFRKNQPSNSLPQLEEWIKCPHLPERVIKALSNLTQYDLQEKVKAVGLSMDWIAITVVGEMTRTDDYFQKGMLRDQKALRRMASERNRKEVRQTINHALKLPRLLGKAWFFLAHTEQSDAYLLPAPDNRIDFRGIRLKRMISILKKLGPGLREIKTRLRDCSISVPIQKTNGECRHKYTVTPAHKNGRAIYLCRKCNDFQMVFRNEKTKRYEPIDSPKQPLIWKPRYQWLPNSVNTDLRKMLGQLEKKQFGGILAEILKACGHQQANPNALRQRRHQKTNQQYIEQTENQRLNHRLDGIYVANLRVAKMQNNLLDRIRKMAKQKRKCLPNNPEDARSYFKLIKSTPKAH